MHHQKYKYVGELPTISHSLLCQPQLTFQTSLSESINPLQAISCNSYIAMYLNTVMLSLLLGTVFMTVQLTTAQIQINFYSDNNCRDYVTDINASTSITSANVTSLGCNPVPPNAGSFELVCHEPQNNCTEVTYSSNCSTGPNNLGAQFECKCDTFFCPCTVDYNGTMVSDGFDDRVCHSFQNESVGRYYQAFTPVSIHFNLRQPGRY